MLSADLFKISHLDKETKVILQIWVFTIESEVPKEVVCSDRNLKDHVDSLNRLCVWWNWNDNISVANLNEGEHSSYDHLEQTL